jgi:hypothetical protein
MEWQEEGREWSGKVSEETEVTNWRKGIEW